ncbi:S9 family peptidase [Phenylobacterium sp.]|uniref:S9 family peptidase n=1 Tax=Phenylobacterium sp. TaxID=1871053 RepID=UPI002F407B52
MGRTIAGALAALGLAILGPTAGGALAADPATTPSTAKPAPAQPPLNASVRDVRDVRGGAVSPDGRQVAALIAASTAEGGQTHIWLLSADGKAARQATFTTGETDPGERAPAWSHDGKSLFFLAKRGKAERLYRLPMAGGEAQALTVARPASGPVKAGWTLKAEDAVEVAARSYDIAPDDHAIALVAADGETAARDAEVKKKDDAVRVGRDDKKPVRLYLVDAASGQARAVDLPDEVQSARWSPDGKALLVVTAPPDEDLGPAARLWRVRAADGTATQVTAAPKTVRQPLWTATGAVWLAQCEEDAPPGCAELYAYDFAAGAARGLTKGLKGSLASGVLVVEKGGRSVVTPLAVGVKSRLARIDLASGAMSFIDTPQPVVLSLATNPDESAWAYVATGPTQPPAMFAVAHLGEPATKLAGPAITPPDWPMTPSQTVTWKSGKLQIEGLVYLPKGASASAKAPLVVVVHGGPTGVFQDRYSNLVNLLVAQGWAVLETNPRGSEGYGAAFEAANRNDLGGGDYADIMSGVDMAIAKFPVDPARMALIGYSYGGEMAAFVEGRTDRFKALVSGAPVIDQFSEYGTEDEAWYDRWYFGQPWLHFADAWRQSALSRVAHAKTPLLLLQGEEDPTDPLGQSQEMRRALREMGAPVVLVTYPRETHAGLGAGFGAQPSREPWHGDDLRRRMLAFLADAFAGKDPAAEPPSAS